MTTTNGASDTAWGKIRNLTRRRDNTMVGGVCAGLGEATVIPAWMWRVGFCSAALIWGTGFIAYLVLMVCIPEESA